MEEWKALFLQHHGGIGRSKRVKDGDNKWDRHLERVVRSRGLCNCGGLRLESRVCGRGWMRQMAEWMAGSCCDKTAIRCNGEPQPLSRYEATGAA